MHRHRTNIRLNNRDTIHYKTAYNFVKYSTGFPLSSDTGKRDILKGFY
uniref:Uncharacterized protein n=1 Tax=Anguilla anguilla TaxID=7936 RepID=A0A0E9VCJ5_ANGAN